MYVMCQMCRTYAYHVLEYSEYVGVWEYIVLQYSYKGSTPVMYSEHTVCDSQKKQKKNPNSN